jgi:prepilin-type N-terminal cleavage/methylation domain-containing protein
MNNKIQLKEKLELLASRQCGYFTSAQAKKIGYRQDKFSYHIKNNWVKVNRGLFRLSGFEDTFNSRCVCWFLWSRNINEQPQGIISHQSALMYYNIIEQNIEEEFHLTVPTGFRKRNIPKEGLVLHKENLPLSDLENHGAVMTTNLFRTLKDTKEELELQGKLSDVADKVAKSGKLTQTELLRLGIITSDGKHLNTSGNNIDGILYLGGKGDIKNDEVYYRAQDAKKIFDSLERKGRWAMSASSFHGGKSHQRGFTLVELLVVIAIISILAGMLLPALENAAQTAKSLYCMSNIKQVALNEMNYSIDNDGWCMPNVQRLPSGTSRYFPWWMVELGYLDYDISTLSLTVPNEGTIFDCPNESQPEPDLGVSWRGTNYGFNKYMTYALSSAPERFWKKNSRIKSPSRRVLLGDSGSGNNGSVIEALTGTCFPKMRHIGRWNYSFLDMHQDSSDFIIEDTRDYFWGYLQD